MSLPVRIQAALIHFLASVVLVCVLAAVILGVWFPDDYVRVARGWQLLLLIFAVDAVCGPLLTAVVFNPAKPRAELAKDLGVVIVLQLAALGYGVHATHQARPVYTVFEADRFRVITAAEIDDAGLPTAPPALRTLPLDGPRQIGVRVPQPADPDFTKSLDLTMAGLEVSFRPSLWRPYEEQRAVAIQRSRPLVELMRRRPEAADALQRAVDRSGLPADALNYLPAQTRRHNDDWVALMRRDDGRVVGFAPVDGF